MDQKLKVTTSDKEFFLFDDEYIKLNSDEDDSGAYLMIKNIGHLFYYMGDFSLNKDKKF